MSVPSVLCVAWCMVMPPGEEQLWGERWHWALQEGSLGMGWGLIPWHSAVFPVRLVAAGQNALSGAAVALGRQARPPSYGFD